MYSINRLWWLTLAIKILIIAFLPLFHDETYYWQWSHHLQLSYFDHPPFISWVLWFGHPFEDFLNLARLPVVVLGHIALLIWILIAKSFLSDARLKWFFLVLLVMPLSGLSLLVATPDVPLMFFWALAIYQTLQLAKNPNALNYALLGIWMGLGFSSKYHMVIYAPLLLIWLGVFQRRLITVKGFFLTTLFGTLGSLPVLIWNWKNDFVSFAFQLNHGLGESTWEPSWTYVYILGQIIALSPFIVFFVIKNFPDHFKNKDSQKVLLTIMAFGPILFFVLSSFRGHVEANWPIVAHPSFLLLGFVLMPNSLKWAKSHFFVWLGLFAIVFASLIKPNFLGLKKLNESKEYSALVEASKTLKPFYADSFQMASQLSFQNKSPIYKLRGSHRLDFYDFIEQSKPKSDIFYYGVRKGRALPALSVEQGHKEIRRDEISKDFEVLTVQTPLELKD